MLATTPSVAAEGHDGIGDSTSEHCGHLITWNTVPCRCEKPTDTVMQEGDSNKRVKAKKKKKPSLCSAGTDLSQLCEQTEVLEGWWHHAASSLLTSNTQEDLP